MPNARICTLGEFRITVDEIDITNIMKSSPKKLLLLQALIINKDEPLPVDKLVEMLWEQPEEMGQKNTLKTLVSRLRADLEKYGLENAIITVDGTYAWNTDLDCFVDIYALEEYYNELIDTDTLRRGNRKKFEAVLDIYGDDLLSLSNMSQNITENILYYKNLYISVVSKYISLLKEEGKYGKIVEVCKKALILNSYNSMLNLELKSALYNQSKAEEFTEDGDIPKAEALSMYKSLLRKDENFEDDIENIFKELSEYGEEKGAFYCEYPIFKEVYSLHMRNLKRLGSVMFLVMISLKIPTGTRPDAVNFIVKNLRMLLQNNLRSGDTVCKYKSTLFAALLPMVQDHEVASMVLDRLHESFIRNPENKGFDFEYKLVKLDDTHSEDIDI